MAVMTNAAIDQLVLQLLEAIPKCETCQRPTHTVLTINGPSGELSYSVKTCYRIGCDLHCDCAMRD